VFGREVVLLKSARSDKNMRKCILTKELCYKSDLIRFVVGPNKFVVPDVAGRLPGRGLWLKAKKDIVTAACDKGIFTNVLKDKVSVPIDMADLIEGLLRKRCHELMGMARRAGQMVGGYAKVGLFLSSKDAGIIIVASDSRRSRSKEKTNIPPDAKFVFCFSSSELGRIFDRDKIVYAVISSGSFTTNLLLEIKRLSGFFKEENERSYISR